MRPLMDHTVNYLSTIAWQFVTKTGKLVMQIFVSIRPQKVPKLLHKISMLSIALRVYGISVDVCFKIVGHPVSQAIVDSLQTVETTTYR